MTFFLIAYIALQFGIGFWASRRIKNESDFLLAGRHVPGYLLTFSLFATWFGAETCIGTSAEIYSVGLSGGRADPFGYSLCLILLGLLVAPKIWNQKYTTLADFYRDRFGHRVEKIAILILLTSSILWGAAQIRAFGQVIAATTDYPVEWTIFIGFAVVLGYSLLGGLMGDILTDFVQGIVLTIGLIAVLFVIVKTEGLHIFNQPAERWSFLSADENMWQRIDRWAIPIMGSLIAQESIARIFASKNKSQATRMSLFAGALYIFVGSLPVLLGFIGPSLLPELADKEHFLIAISEKYLHPAAQALLVGALVSAILSTIDSILLAGGGLLSHNLLIPLLGEKGVRKKLILSRLCVVAIALTAFVLALTSEGIYELVETASSLGSAGILVITLIGLWSSKGQQESALLALVLGVIFMPIAENVLNFSAPFLATVVVAFLGYWGAWLFNLNSSSKSSVYNIIK